MDGLPSNPACSLELWTLSGTEEEESVRSVLREAVSEASGQPALLGPQTNLVAVGLWGQLLVQRSHVGCQSLESIPDFVLLTNRSRDHKSALS